MALKRQYLNKTDSVGIRVTEATPIDDRLYVESELDIIAATAGGNIELFPGVMYDGLMIITRDTGRSFIWRESEYGLLDIGYSYPIHFNDIQGQDYAGKTYNLVIADTTNRIEMTYDEIEAPTGLKIPNGNLPLHILKDPITANVIVRSDEDSYASTQYPDRIEAFADHILVVFDPAPAIGEQFKVSIF